jgi:DNA-binding XRE family transcriptional regulator
MVFSSYLFGENTIKISYWCFNFENNSILLLLNINNCRFLDKINYKICSKKVLEIILKTPKMDKNISRDKLVLQIGQKIREHRTEKNQTIEKLAFEAGLDYSQLSRIERGKINTSIYHLYLISNALDVPVTTLFVDITK